MSFCQPDSLHRVPPADNPPSHEPISYAFKFHHTLTMLLSKKQFGTLLLFFCTFCLATNRTEATSLCTTADTISPGLKFPTDTLRLLCIGNSYSLDGTICLPQMLEDAGVSRHKYGIYCAMYAGASLEYWYDYLVNDKEVPYVYHMGGTLTLPDTTWTVKTLLHEPWDVIVLQQYSNISDEYDTFTPYIGTLVDAIRKESSNKDILIAWHMTWSHSPAFYSKPYCEEGWQDIADATERLCEEYDIPIVIPVGTAIQNARSTSINDDMELTREGTHIANGVGHYIAGITWFETFCRPVFGVSSLDAPPSPKVRAINADKTPFYAITDDNYAICQQCAYDALRSPYRLTKNSEDTATQKPVRSNPILRPVAVYDMQGKRLPEVPDKGTYIKGGKKYVVP